MGCLPRRRGAEIPIKESRGIRCFLQHLAARGLRYQLIHRARHVSHTATSGARRQTRSAMRDTSKWKSPFFIKRHVWDWSYGGEQTNWRGSDDHC
jgi:hypothetical protein